MRKYQLVFVVVASAFAGWALAQAQRPDPDFLLEIESPAGMTTVRCISGCLLVGSRDLGNPNAHRMKRYFFTCEGASVTRCGARAAGWHVPPEEKPK
jgi:hypothetical protein